MAESSAELVIPEWVPKAVAIKARELYRERDMFGFGDCRPVVKRLATDQRMKKVWEYLVKKARNKPTRPYFHQAISDHRGTAEEQQAAAMTAIFHMALSFAVNGTKYSLKRKDHPKASEWKKMGDRIAKDADEFRQIVESSSMRRGKEYVNHLLKAADVYRQFAQNIIAPTGWLFVEPGRDVEARGFAVTMTHMIGTHFQSPDQRRVRMYGIVATIASVALNEKVTPEQVREWCRGTWAKNLEKRGVTPPLAISPNNWVLTSK